MDQRSERWSLSLSRHLTSLWFWNQGTPAGFSFELFPTLHHGCSQDCWLFLPNVSCIHSLSSNCTVTTLLYYFNSFLTFPCLQAFPIPNLAPSSVFPESFCKCQFPFRDIPLIWCIHLGWCWRRTVNDMIWKKWSQYVIKWKKKLQNTSSVTMGDLRVVESWMTLFSFCLFRALKFFAINIILIIR